MSTELTTESFVGSEGRVVKLQGELDIATIGIAETALALGFDVLDVSELAFLDSSGVRMLLQARQRRDSAPVLRGLGGQVRRILEMTGLAEMFVIEDARGSASVSPSSSN